MDRFTHKFSKHLKKFSGGSPETPSKTTAAPSNLFVVPEHHHQRAIVDDSPKEFREVKIKNVEELGNVFSTSTMVKRDLGFQGKLGRHIVLTYGDTMFTNAQGDDKFRGMTCNSPAIACDDPTQVFDPVVSDNGYPDCLLKPDVAGGEDPSVWSLGITNVVETSHGRGVLYFLLNYRPDGTDQLVGAGVAEVTIDTTGNRPTPKARRLSKFWWDAKNEPWYGDVCALRAGDHIYAYGHAKPLDWVYLARVKADEATNLNSYEYWNGDTWQSERLTIDTLGEKQSIFWQINQGQIYWSEYHQCFLFIYCDNFWSCQVLVKVAMLPEGPWSEPVTVYKPKPVEQGGNVYAAVPHPYFDPSGKTLVITFTNHPNTIQAIKVDFE